MAVVEVSGLQKAYGGRRVVDDVSFDVEHGEIFGILGPNGAGKTTTVECIEGLRHPDAGEIRVLGLDPRSDEAELRTVLGAQLQGSRLQDEITVGEALNLYSSFYDHPVDGSELLAMLAMAEQRDVRFGKLSGGQQQRLAIALALVGRPAVAVLDELTTGLDPQARRDTWSLVERVRDTGVTVLLVTHLMEEAERLCDRVAVFAAGRIVAIDTPAGILGRAAAGQRLRFRPSEPLDLERLEGLQEVTAVVPRGRQVVVTGSGDLVQAVMSHLAREQVIAHELRVEQETLDDAFVALTGHPTTDRDEGKGRR